LYEQVGEICLVKMAVHYRHAGVQTVGSEQQKRKRYQTRKKDRKGGNRRAPFQAGRTAPIAPPGGKGQLLSKPGRRPVAKGRKPAGKAKRRRRRKGKGKKKKCQRGTS